MHLNIVLILNNINLPFFYNTIFFRSNKIILQPVEFSSDTSSIVYGEMHFARTGTIKATTEVFFTVNKASLYLNSIVALHI